MPAVVARIRDRYRGMTPTYRSLADYVLEHQHDVAFASVARVSQAAGVSPATVVRFSEHLGLSGYTELQALARESLRQDLDTVSQLKRAAPDGDPQSVLATALRADIANLERTIEQLPDRNFTRALEILVAADTIHLVGLRSTFGLVQHFESYLGWIGRKAHVLRPGIGELPEQLLAIQPGDACIAFSFRRYTRDTVSIFQAARAAGATTIAITDSDLSPLAEHAELTLAVPVHFPAFFESRVAVLSIMNALVLGIAIANRPRTITALRRHEAAWFKHGIYLNEGFRSRFNAQVEAFAAADDITAPRPPRRSRSTQSAS